MGDSSIAHLAGVYMPADVGTKPVGPTRFEDLVHTMDLHSPHLPQPKGPPNPKVAALRTGMTPIKLLCPEGRKTLQRLQNAWLTR